MGEVFFYIKPTQWMKMCEKWLGEEMHSENKNGRLHRWIQNMTTNGSCIPNQWSCPRLIQLRAYADAAAGMPGNGRSRMTLLWF
jgi:hypothetical protein